MSAHIGSLFLAGLILLPLSVRSAPAEETRGPAIVQALLDAYAPRQPQAPSSAADAARGQALSRAQSILNNLGIDAATSALASPPSNNPPAEALDDLKKLQDVLGAVRPHGPARRAPAAPAATPIINTQELMRLFSNPLPEQDLRTQLKSAAELHPENAVVWFLLAYQEQQLGHQKKSQAALERALATAPDGMLPDSVRAQLKEGIPAPQ